MRKLIVLSALAAALASAATAGAGGWATVGIDPLPDGVEAGGTWNTEITIRQHGQTPLDGLSPAVTIFEDGGATDMFSATPTGEPGVYAASVVFPEAGSWNVVVDSGFGDSRLTYGPVTVDAGSPGGSTSPVLTTGLVAVGAALALVAIGVFGVRRLRRLTPASH
jgi:hypothetical protein